MNGLDLNLLTVLEALLQERSVSRAAVRLRKSQPAVSNALGRLRKTLGDPLFVRGAEGMLPTPRALELAGPVASALRSLDEALATPPAFEPTTAERTFVIAASDHAQLLVLPTLAQRLQKWRGLKLRVVPLPRDFPMRELERGELDLVLGVFGLAPGDAAPAGLRRQLLAEERIFAVARKGHPALRGQVERPRQLNVSPRGGTSGAFEKALPRKLSRDIVLYMPHYLTAPWVLATTDLVAGLPERVARRFTEYFPLECVPVDWIKSTLKVHQLWHPRAHTHPANRWLRTQILSAARGSGSGAERAT